MEDCGFAEFGTVKSRKKDYSYRVQILDVLREWTSFGDMKDRVNSLNMVVLDNIIDIKCIQDWLELEVDLRIMKKISETLEAERKKYDNYYTLSTLSYLGAIKALMKFPNIKIFITYDNEEIMESCDKEWVLQAVNSRRELKNTLAGFSAHQKELKCSLDHEWKYQLFQQKLREEDELMKLNELEDRYKLLCRRVVSAKQKTLESADMGSDLNVTCCFVNRLIENLESSMSHLPEFQDDEEFENLQCAQKNKRGDGEEEN